ncbi:carboxypeptidase regulatory-like domain-containing protein [Streptomyces sp. MBT65]|uniref:carboxypeptidase regulatory-like domain-containing protein n=1 Tax=Streptomyces sp. MBT65 TaxID=1488395 RepID=UPI00190BA3FD|nr:carboxypeptidase regulatory-like domain-containing protein [Streptomyces sp. MBT65]MBK3574232.1 carboxypeptidase regulatory-like domain-containing protein [Streptomyces sp. MBT65]
MTDRRTFPHGRPSSMPVRRRPLLLLTAVFVAGTALLPSGVAAAEPLRADVLGGGVTIVPGRSGLVEISGYKGAALPAGSALRLTAPAGARVTGTPLADTARFQGSVTADGASGTYTYVRDSGAGSWKDSGYPFALTVDERAVPGTRLPGCVVVLTDAGGVRRASGGCTVTVGMPVPTLGEPAGGTFVSGAARIAGTSYPGARVSVMDAAEHTVCAAVTRADTTWSCTPDTPLPAGANRLHASAVFNGVSAVGEDVDFTVTARTA